MNVVKGTNPISSVSTDMHRPDNYTFSPVTVMMTGTAGVISLSVVALILLRALLRALARNRELEIQLAKQAPNA